MAERTPVLVVLDDLHWADDATLRTLRHVLATTPPDARLVVVATRRAHPEPTGALAEVGEAFARRHALRLDLDGLGTDEARTLVRSVAGPEIGDATADAWHRRAAGNPFFLVELARLDEKDVAEVPATVRDVVTRRLAVLDDGALDTLRLAAVAGRRFQAMTVAAAAAADLDDVLDDLETARAAGLVVEEDAGDYSFAHALTRDSVYQSVPSTRRSRLHAQVANAFESDPAVRRLLAADELHRRAGAALAGRRTEPPRQGLARGQRLLPTRPAACRRGARRSTFARPRWPPSAAARTARRTCCSTCCSSSAWTLRTPPAGRTSSRRAWRRWSSAARWARPRGWPRRRRR